MRENRPQRGTLGRLGFGHRFNFYESQTGLCKESFQSVSNKTSDNLQRAFAVFPGQQKKFVYFKVWQNFTLDLVRSARARHMSCR